MPTSSPGCADATIAEPTVFIIDDDADVRDALDALLRSVGLRAESFGSTEAFAASGRLGAPGCLLLDLRLPGQSGLRFQSRLVEEGREVAVVFMSAHADVQMAVQAMKNGAIDVLTKPLRPPDVIDAVNLALAADAARRRERLALDVLIRSHAALSEREREVMALVVAGRSNREAAETLGLAEATVKAHRAGVMRKMGVRTLAHLVEAARELREVR